MNTAAAARGRAHPAAYRTSILLAALVAVGIWWGLGLPYSIATWLLDERQLSWTLFCYAWEVPAAGLLGPVLVPQIWWRRIERRWNSVFAADPVDPDAVGTVEALILDYPLRVAWVFLASSVLGYAVGAVQLAVFAQLPPVQLLHVGVLGLVTGLVGALFAFLYLERLLSPLLRDLGRQRPTALPTGRHIPIRTKVFACSFVLIVCTVPLFGTVFWNQGARILEEEAGERMLVVARVVAERIARGEEPAASLGAMWQRLATNIGTAHLIDDRGSHLADDGRTDLAAQGFRQALVDRVLSSPAGYAIDRTHRPRIVAFAAVGSGDRRIVAVAPRSALDHQLRHGLHTAAAVFAATLTLTLLGGYLFARRLSRPIEIVTMAANQTARHLDAPAELTSVRTNDEVGELTVALNNMTIRLQELTAELTRYSEALEDRVREATRDVTTLYDATRAVTSTLDREDALRLIGARVSAALSLRQLIVLRYSPHDGTADAWMAGRGQISLRDDVDLSELWEAGAHPVVRDLAEIRSTLPPSISDLLGESQVLCLPLPFKGLLIGVILAALESSDPAPNLPLAGALGVQVAAALANVGLFETVQRHERELLELIERQTELREETSRDISRELHDGMGQALTAIKLELGLLQRDAPTLTPTELAERTQHVQASVSEVIQEVRTMSQLLRPTMLDDLGLVPSIRSHIDGVCRRADLSTALHFPSELHRLPPAIELLLYRVTQEAFTNIVKHAAARHADLTLEIGRSRATLTIVDDGVGFSPRHSGAKGIGLLGMRERVAYHGGRIDIWSEPGAGTRIRLSVPLTAVDEVGAREA